MENVFEIVGAITMILTGLYTISLLIPGDQPDKALEKILDFTKRFSKK